MLKFLLTSVLAFLLILSFQFIVSSQTFAEKSLVGTYILYSPQPYQAIELRNDGIFVETYFDCINIAKDIGTYTEKNGILVIKVLKTVERRILPDDFYGQTQSAEINEFSPTDKQKKPIKTLRLIPVKWSERIYLINDDGILEFCNAINLGVEPRNSTSPIDSLPIFYLKSSDAEEISLENLALPINWKSFLLKEPVTAKVISVKATGKKFLVTIDKGKRNGLKVGMRMVKNELNAFTSLILSPRIISATNETAVLESIEKFEVGDVLSSKVKIQVKN